MSAQKLLQNRVPRLSLVNYLYRDKLPEEIQDLTWVEETVCALSTILKFLDAEEIRTPSPAICRCDARAE